MPDSLAHGSSLPIIDDVGSALVLKIASFLDGGMSLDHETSLFSRPSLRTWRNRALAAASHRWPEKVLSHLAMSQALEEEHLSEVDVFNLERGVVGAYPARRYPAVFVGAAHGSVAHLASALGVPWLPQTFLLTIRRERDADRPDRDLEWGALAFRRFLDANPTVGLHHVFDSNEQRTLCAQLAKAYVKIQSLGHVYADFVQQCLEPGGTIFLVDSQLKWPVVTLGERQFFQHGSLGGAFPEEYYQGSSRVAEFLERSKSSLRQWPNIFPDQQAPEAEWGFADALVRDVEEFAARNKFVVKRISFQELPALSSFTAELYRAWHSARVLPSNRLIVECGSSFDPWWVLRTGAAPFWLPSNAITALESLEFYLKNSLPYDDIHLTLLSRGHETIGMATLEQWRAVLQRARRKGEFLAIDEHEYPRQPIISSDYEKAFSDAVHSRYPLPPALAVEDLLAFADTKRSGVVWSTASGETGSRKMPAINDSRVQVC